jgi:DNA-binding response OmpR family regulator
MSSSAYMQLRHPVLLCIDDDEDLLECEKAFLETFGYTVLTASNGGKGLELASTHSVEVVIVDYFMPQMNGQEVALEMRRLSPDTLIIMLSGATDVPDQTLKLVDAFVSKDCLASQLVPTIAHLRGCTCDPPLSYHA